MNILLHICCAPCAIYPIESLRDKGHNVSGLYFNPNIHPAEEFAKRQLTLKEYAKLINLEVTYLPEYLEDTWTKFAADFDRCSFCYQIRLEYAFLYAKEHGFDGVTTSLLVSPYQKHDLIIKISRTLSDKYQIPFYYEDFRIGYRYGQNKAKEWALYRQKYCGCILSLNEHLTTINVKNKNV